MTQTILITGASSGIGKVSAALFHKEGWNVVATMRNPDDGKDLADLDRVLILELDVTKPETIANAIQQALERFGTIDALLNNAGYGAFGALEAFDMARIERQFNTNVIGLMAVTKALLPHFRERRSGTIINVSSMGGRYAFPLGALYHGTKFAVEGISEALYYEMDAIGVNVKIVEPGRIITDFNTRSLDVAIDESMTEYLPVVQGLMAASNSADTIRSEPELVAEVIYSAATDGTKQLRYTVGKDAELAVEQLKSLDEAGFLASIKKEFGLS